MTAIFISHSSADNAAAAEMKAWLEAQGHTSLFLDFDPEAGIKGGSAWKQTLYQQLRQCQAVIALLTPNWLASKWCFAELVLAQERGKEIFPVKVQPCAAGGVFSDIQHIDLTAEPEEGYRRLKIGLLERGLDPLDVFDWDPKRPPYPGLLAFQEADAAIFFGRGEEILKTLETLDALRRQGREAARFALLLGASGSGKSSLARAGVIPRLKKKPAEWLPVPPFRPQQEPLDELAVALAAAFESLGRPRDWSVIRTELHAAAAQNPVDGLALLKLTRDLAIVVKQSEATVLLTIDQAEELFGYSPSEAATRFLRLLRAALEAADRQLMAVATLRSDFLGEFQSHSVLQDSEYPHHFRYRAVPVDPMPLRNFHAIIQGPARLAGVQLDDGLVETIVQDTATRDALPLLAFTLRRLYERYADDGRLTVGEYETLGRLEGAIREEAQRVIAEADPAPEELEALHAAFVPTMVRINAEGGYARRRARFAAMTQRAVPLLRRFVDARLLVTDRDPQGRETIEVAHEALLRTWPLLGGWLAEDQDKLRLLESFQRSAKEWYQGGRRDDLLVHRDTRLKDAEALLANPRFSVPEASVERVYLNACGAAQQADVRQQRRNRFLVRGLQTGLGVAALAAIVGGLFAWFQRNEALEQARVATSRQLAAQSRSFAERTDLALLWSVAAVKTGETLEARQSLLVGLQGVSRRMTFLWGPKSNEAAVFSPDGQTLAMASESAVILWDVASHRPVNTLADVGKSPVTRLGFLADGKMLVATKLDGTLLVWDLTTPTSPPRVIETQSGNLLALAVSPDGSTLALGGAPDGTIQLWRSTNWELYGGPLSGLHERIWSLAFSSDGARLAAGTENGSVLIWEVSKRSMTKVRASHQGRVWKVAFSPDGQLLASAGEDGEVKLCNSIDGNVLGSLPKQHGHKDGVMSLAFSPDGMLLATGSKDSTIIIWDFPNRRPLVAPLREHRSSVRDLNFSPDGALLASASRDTSSSTR